jgi:hypothetical protein
MIGILVDYYMGEFSPYRKGQSRVKIGDKSVSSDLTTFMARHTFFGLRFVFSFVAFLGAAVLPVMALYRRPWRCVSAVW